MKELVEFHRRLKEMSPIPLNKRRMNMEITEEKNL